MIHMKKLAFFFTLYLPLTFFSQGNYQRYDHKNIIVKGDFLKNNFNSRYLLIGDFMPVMENSKIKLAKVFTSNGWGYIDEKGNEVIRPAYESISNFRHGVVSAKLMEEQRPDNPEKRFQDLNNILLNYLGEVLTSESELANQYLDDYYLQKDYFIIVKNGLQGAMNNSGKTLVPAKYESIHSNKDYFFAYYAIINNEYSKRITDIYSKKGKLLKSLKGSGINSFGNRLFITEYNETGNSNGGYFLNYQTLERGEKKEYRIFNPVEKSKLFKMTVMFERGDDIYEQFYLDKNLEIVSQDYPNTYIYDDQFLIQPLPVGKDPAKATHFAVIDFKNHKIAEYSHEDFLLYQYFAHGKLNDPIFLESQKSYWKTLEKDDHWRYEKWDYFLDKELMHTRDRFVQFYETTADKKKRLSVGYFDANTGEILFKRSLSEILSAYIIRGTDLFQVSYLEDDIRKIEIINSKGESVAKITGGRIDAISKYFSSLVFEDATKENLYKPKKNLINLKTFKPVFSENMKDFNGYYYSENQDYLLFTNHEGKKGIINKNFEIIRIDDYTYIRDDVGIDYNLIYLKKNDEIEIVEKGTYHSKMKVQFEPGILKNYGDNDKWGNRISTDILILGTYKNGFYLINEEKMVMDRYGNIIDKPHNFNIRD